MAATFLVALGLVFVIEGLIYALVPRQLKHVLTGIMKMSDEQLRLTGAMVLAFGVGLVWLARVFFG